MYKAINGWTKASMKEHVIKNFKGKSVDSFGACVYRGEGGLKCGVGLFIPDSLYYVDMEGASFPSYVNNQDHPRRESFEKAMPIPVPAMYYFQRCHDQSEPTTTLKDMLSWIDRNIED